MDAHVASSVCGTCLSHEKATRLDLHFFARTACVLDALCHRLLPPPSLQMPASEHGQERVALPGRIVMWNETDSAGRLCLNTLSPHAVRHTDGP